MAQNFSFSIPNWLLSVVSRFPSSERFDELDYIAFMPGVDNAPNNRENYKIFAMNAHSMLHAIVFDCGTIPEAVCIKNDAKNFGKKPVRGNMTMLWQIDVEMLGKHEAKFGFQGVSYTVDCKSPDNFSYPDVQGMFDRFTSQREGVIPYPLQISPVDIAKYSIFPGLGSAGYDYRDDSMVPMSITPVSDNAIFLRSPDLIADKVALFGVCMAYTDIDPTPADGIVEGYNHVAMHRNIFYPAEDVPALRPLCNKRYKIWDEWRRSDIEKNGD